MIGMTTLLDFIGITTGTGITGGMTILGDTDTGHTSTTLIITMGIIIITILLLSLILELYLKIMGEEEKK